MMLSKPSVGTRFHVPPASLVCAQGMRWRQLLALLVQKYNLTRLD
jgi:hypothetical protein